MSKLWTCARPPGNSAGRNSFLNLSSLSTSLLEPSEETEESESGSCFKSIREESIANFYAAQRAIQDTFLDVIAKFQKEEQTYQGKLEQLKVI